MRFVKLVFGRSGTHEYGTRHESLPLFELQRTVVDRGRQTEAVLYQILFAGIVASEHTVYLRYGNVAFVDEDEKIFREIVEDAKRTTAGRAVVEVSRIVLHSRAITDLAYHLYIVCYAFLQPFGFVGFIVFSEKLYLLAEVESYEVESLVDTFLRGGEDGCGVEVEAIENLYGLPCGGVECFEAVDVVVPEYYPQYKVSVCGKNIDGIALYSEVTSVEVYLVSAVIGYDE